MPVMKHTHRYVLKTLGKSYQVYACNIGTCTHYLAVNMIEGKHAVCNRCGNTFIIGKQVLYGSQGKPMKKPHCFDCTKSKNPVVDITDFLTGKENA